MSIILTYLIVMALSYYIYIDAQKRGVNKEYLWVLFNTFIPFVGFLFYLWRRPKNIINTNIQKKPYGFRSMRKGKIVVATLAYLLIFGFTAIAATAPPTDPSKPVNAQLSTTPVETAKATESVKPVTQEAVVTPVTPPVADVVQTTSVKAGDKLKVSYIDVGQADSILIQIPNGKNVLIDAGNNGDATTIVNYLKAQNITKLDYVIGTHSHEDHIGSMDTVINTFDIGNVVIPKESSNTQTFRDFMTAISNKGLKPIEAKVGVKLDLGSEVSAELLAPNSSGYTDINDYSAVVRLVYGKNIFLFTGDAESQSESEMLHLGSQLKADVLKVGHHGSKSSSTTEFLSKVQPKYAVISVGKGNTYGHPTQEALGRLSGIGATIYRTDESGTIVCESDGTNITFNVLGSSVQPRAPSTAAPIAASAPSSNAVAKPTPAPVQSNNQSGTVFGTKTGKKYHADGCRYITSSKIQMTLSEAKAKGLTPCSVCNPPQ